jgi:hypothetical protein
MVRQIREQPSENVVIKAILNASGITEEKITQQISEKIEAHIREALNLKVLFIDLERLKEIVPFERDFLEKHILCDPRVRKYQRRRGPHSKRVWLCEPTLKAIEEIIMNEWQI